MSKRFSQFTSQNTVSDNDYINITGATNRRIVWPDFLENIYDRIVTPFIYPTIVSLQEAPLRADEDYPVYVRVEETEYRLYKITNIAPGEDDIELDNGNTATAQTEYRDIGFVVGPETSTIGALATYNNETGTLLANGPTPSTVGVNLIEFPDSATDGYFRKKNDNTLELLTGDQLKVNLSLNNVDNTSDAQKVASGPIFDALALKAPLLSPELTGTPTAPTAAADTNTTQIATTAYVQGEIVDRIQSVATIADLLDVDDFTEGKTVNVKGYHGSFGNLGGGIFFWDPAAPKSTHNGGSVIDPNKSFPATWGDQAQINDWFTASPSGVGCWIRHTEGAELNSMMFGAIYQAEFDPAIAFANRKLNEVMLRQAEFSVFRISANPDTMWILGSVHPKRSGIKIIHEKGCTVKFRYDHPDYSVPQSGAGFAFPMYADPDTVGSEDFSITGVVENVDYQLDGEVSTIYDATHTATHNNNCIGFYVAKNCRVTGSGGVGESDHNGINFDGMCTNIDIDISYIMGTSDTPIVVNGPDADDVLMTERGYANIRAGSISEIKFDNAASRSNIIVGHQSSADVWAGVIDGNPLLKGNGVSSFGCDNTKFKFGRLSFVSNVLNQYETEHGSVSGCTIEGADAIVRRGGVAADKHRTVDIMGITAKGSVALTIYRDDAAISTFDRLSVRNCDFSGVSANVTPYGPSIVTLGRPTAILYSDNKPGANWVTNSEIWNRQTQLPVTATNAASTTFNYDMAGVDGDYPYTKLNGYISSSSQFYEYSLDLTLIAKTSTTIKRVVKHTDGTDMVITATKSGAVVTITLTFTTAAVLGLWQVYN